MAHPNPPGELLAMPFIESGVCVTCQLNFEVFTLSDDQILKEKIKIRKKELKRTKQRIYKIKLFLFSLTYFKF